MDRICKIYGLEAAEFFLNGGTVPALYNFLVVNLSGLSFRCNLPGFPRPKRADQEDFLGKRRTLK